MKILLLSIFVFVHSNFAFAQSLNRVPKFRLPDQNGIVFDSESVKGNTYFLLGCGFKDVVLCRKHGRKIYWKMQTLINDRDEVVFSAYLNLKGAPRQVFDYIKSEKEKEYESILLDMDGSLSDGLLDGKSFLRVYSPKGNLLHSEYFTTIDDAKVLQLFEYIKKERKGRNK